MSEDNQQAVVDETNGAATPAPEGTNAREGDELDNLLKEFDERPSASTPAQPEKPAETTNTNDVNTANETVLNEAKFIREQRFKADMDATIEKVRGDLPKELFDGPLVQAWINAQAEKDPRLAQAWANRHTDPKKFDQVVTALGKQFARYGRLPDKAATGDREAVSAAVRGASTSAPAAKVPNYASMTPGEFQAEKDRMFGR